MKKSLFLILFLANFVTGCQHSEDSKPEKARELSDEFKQYWYDGTAEITSYQLSQNRYGEPRDGTAVLIYVTEDFHKDEQVKANNKSENSTSVLKLNETRKFVTGIYPYSIMQSTFFPLEYIDHPLKITVSVQEWCGQTYIQLNKKKKFELQSHTYFEGKADENFSLLPAFTENEIWTQLRINPNNLPTGDFQMIPSLLASRLHNIELKEYNAFGEFYQDDTLSVYKVLYAEIGRTIKIYYNPQFPYTIEKWMEIEKKNGNEFQTTATKMQQIKIDYWNKNSNNDLPLRDKLEL